MCRVRTYVVILCLLVPLSWSIAGLTLEAPDPQRLEELTAQFRETQKDVPRYPDQGEEICFVADDGLYVMYADGTGARRIVQTSTEFPYFNNPCWSLDGTKIAFNASSYSGGERIANLVVCDADGSYSTIIFSAYNGYSFNGFQSFSWSPDNQWIMFNYGYNDIQNNVVWVNCTIQENGANFSFDQGFSDCTHSEWDPNDATRRAMVTIGMPFDFNTRLRWRKLDGSYEEIWLIAPDAIAAMMYCSWYNSNTIYTILTRGDLIGYPDRWIILKVTSSGYSTVTFSELDAQLHSISFSPNRQYMVSSEWTTTSTMFRQHLPSGTFLNLGYGFYPNWRQHIPGVEESTVSPSVGPICQCTPNPFKEYTTIAFHTQHSNFVSLSVYDVTGKKVALLLDGEVSAGDHQVRWHPNNLPTGTYFIRLETETSAQTKRLVYVK